MAKKVRKSEETPTSDVDSDTPERDAAVADAQPDAGDDDHSDGDAEAAELTEEPTSSVEAQPDTEMEDTPADDAPEDATEDEPSEADAPEETPVSGTLPAHGGEAPVSPPVSATPAVSSGPGAGALIFGGLLAGAIGFAAAWFFPQSDMAPATDPVMEDRIAALEAEVAGVEMPAPFDSSAIDARQGDTESRIDTLEATLDERIEAMSSRLDGIAATVDELAARPVFEAGDTEAAMNEQIAAFEQIIADAGAEARAELDQLRADAEAMRSEAEAMQAEAIAATEMADRRAALASVQAAIDSGEPYEDALAALDDAPAALTDFAASGVPTLSELRQSFPDAARAALAAAGSDETEESASGMARITDFLRRQTNARSLAPKDGGGVDATLSRAEAALNSGDLSGALSELETLPDAASEAMSGWLTDARARLGATNAAEELVEG